MNGRVELDAGGGEAGRALGVSVGGGHAAKGPECGEARPGFAGKAHEVTLEG